MAEAHVACPKTKMADVANELLVTASIQCCQTVVVVEAMCCLQSILLS